MSTVPPPSAESSKSSADAGWTVRGQVWAWVLAWLLLGLVYVVVIPWTREWIELFNGATWPSSGDAAVSGKWTERIGFSFVVAARTLLNLGTATVVAYLLWSELKRRKRKLKTEQQARAFEAAGVGLFFASILAKHTGEQLTSELVSQLADEVEAITNTPRGRALLESLTEKSD